MKQTKEPKYYISIGYISSKKNKASYNIDTKDINFMQLKNSSATYIDDSDKDNIIVVPLTEVDDIHEEDGNTIFRITITPDNVDFKNKTKRMANVIGLFKLHRDENKEVVEHLFFYKYYITFTKTKNIIINIETQIKLTNSGE